MKNFKSIMALAALMLGLCQALHAQKQTGLYLTYSDFVNHKLSYTDGRINIHGFIGSSNISVTSGGKNNRIAKASVFGYRDGGNDYRFCSNLAYQIIDTAGFYVYSYDKLVQQGKGPKAARVYYFSAKPTTEVLRLIPENIADAFRQNRRFYNMVEMEYQSNLKLDAYDNNAKAYKIKELYTESLK